MPTLIQLIEASAAARLPLPTDRLAPLDLAPYRQFLKLETHRLKLRHRATTGGSGRDICRGHAGVIDALLRNLWQRAKNSLSPQAQAEFPPLALVALGGYGRGELNPHSDLDVMLLHYGQIVAHRVPLPHLSKMIDFILMPLFDLNFKVGHAVRTIEESVHLANRDMKTKTALIEARLIVGDEHLFARFQKTILAKCVAGHEQEYIQARLQDQAARRARYGNSPTMQEPNVKNGCGGLRDFQNLAWMAFFKYRTRSLADLKHKEFVTEAEARQLETAYDFLLRTRNELHYQTERPSDVLTRALQPTVATKLGYADRSPSRRLQAFMRQYYNHSRNIYLITRTVEERLALLPKPSRLPQLPKLLRNRFAQPKDTLFDGFKFAQGQILHTSTRIFRDQPRRLLRVFLHAQQRALRLHPDLCQLLRQQLHLVNRAFLQDDHAGQSFLEILNQRGNVAPILRTMHEVGFLGKYLPEFGKMTCLVQHEFYHQYTADEHTLVCLEKLDLVWAAKDPALARYAEEFQQIEHPFILYLALLLHDAGKVRADKPHAQTGSLLALHVARRLHLDALTTKALQLLIEHHLLMAQISQRRDLDDPAVIRHFAALIQNAENLRMLTLHTLVDSLATSDQLWNSFKDSLLWDLFHKTSAELSGSTAFHTAESRQRQLLQEETFSLLPRSFVSEEIQAHFQSLPARYFAIHPARDIASDLTLVHTFIAEQLSEDPLNALKPVLAWHPEPDRAHTRVKICTWDRAGLFSILAGSFAAAGINILSAQIFTRTDNIVLDTFIVTEAASGGPIPKSARDSFQSILSQALIEGKVDFPALIALQTSHQLPSPFLGELLPTHIRFDNLASDERTVVEIETEDRLGLLYALSRTIADLGLNISLAKILTEKGAAIDTFYVSEPQGGKIESPVRLHQLEARLRAALATPPLKRA